MFLVPIMMQIVRNYIIT